jgi:hypothetical protein
MTATTDELRGSGVPALFLKDRREIQFGAETVGDRSECALKVRSGHQPDDVVEDGRFRAPAVGLSCDRLNSFGNFDVLVYS